MFHVIEGVSNSITFRHITPFYTCHVNRISTQTHFTGSNSQISCHTICLSIYNKNIRSRSIIISSRTHIYTAVSIQFHTVKIYSYINCFNNLKSLQVNHRYRPVIIRETITAGIGNIKFSIFYYHFFRLIADYHFTGYSQTCRIHFNHFSRTRIGIYSDRACIRTYISLSIIKSDIPAICHIYLPQMLCRFHIHHLYKIRAIDYGIQLISINLQIISNIPQFFHYGRIPLGINITMILTGSAVIKIKRTLITSHISFIEKIHSFNTDAP